MSKPKTILEREENELKICRKGEWREKEKRGREKL